MPITKGHGNPDWTREETILALDLLYQHGRPLDRHHAEVQELSEFLREIGIHPQETRAESFRNPDGVALKMQNLFSAVEPGRGLSFSRTDGALVKDFPREAAAKLAALAQTLRKSLRVGSSTETSSEDELFVEGQWLTTRHRQRDARLRKRLLDKWRNEHLKCEICDFSASTLTRDLQECLFEAHHTIPLADAEGERATKLKDMALLCACCHRFIHKLISNKRRWVGVEEARSLRFAPKSAMEAKGI